MRYLTALVAACALVIAFVVVNPFGGSGEPVAVLFVGNSYTTSNNLAGTFADLAADGGYDAKVDVVARGGAWLRDHVADGDVRAALAGGDWDFLVLQEQSIVPASSTERVNAMYPAVRQLAAIADDWDTETVLFLTWARRDGFPDVGYGSYEPMQRAITEAYEVIGAEVGARVAPVGEAWSVAHQGSHDLYESDGSHPAESGTYLAAAVLYATVFGKDPTGLEHSGPLETGTADTLRWIAGRAVFREPNRWNVLTTAASP